MPLAWRGKKFRLIVAGNSMRKTAREIRAKFPHIIVEDPAMISVLHEAAELARSDFDLLIVGETGVGKELLAHGIHRLSRRAEGPFVAINLAAIPEGVIESELFGHERGAFTGAGERRLGRFEQADRGTLFMDEIGHLPLHLQAKLLRVLQEKAFYRLGGGGLIDVDVRVVAATDKDLAKSVKEGRFERSLYFRFKGVLRIPPLRERRADVAALAKHYLHTYNRKYGKDIISFSPEALEYLGGQSWPGNVRQLMSVVEGAVLRSGARQQVLGKEDLRRLLVEWEDWQAADSLDRLDQLKVEEVLEQLIRRRLEIHGWNKSRAAESLGISRWTLHAWCKKYGIGKK